MDEKPKTMKDSIAAGIAAGVGNLLGRAEVAQVDDDLTELERSLPPNPNRQQRRSSPRMLKALVRPVVGMVRTTQPLQPPGRAKPALTPHGAKVLRQRRAKNKVARASRQANR